VGVLRPFAAFARALGPSGGSSRLKRVQIHECCKRSNGREEPSLPNAVPQHFASAEKLVLRGRPIADIDHPSAMLRCGPPFRPFAATAKYDVWRTHSLRTKRPSKANFTRYAYGSNRTIVRRECRCRQVPRNGCHTCGRSVTIPTIVGMKHCASIQAHRRKYQQLTL
jgi:hypothetical protein